MRTAAILLACLACVCQCRRVQTRLEKDNDFPEEPQHLHSLVQVSQSPVSGVEVVEKLKSDFANIFWREPRWNNFAQYFSVSDELTGSVLFGLEDNKKFAKLLRGLTKKFSVKDFKVDFLEHKAIESEFVNDRLRGETHHSLNNQVMALWTVELGRKKESPIVIEAQTVFQLNRENKVHFAKLTACYVNGFQVMPIWPVIDLEDEKYTMDSIGEWIQALNKATLSAEKPAEPMLDVGVFPEEGIKADAENIATLKADFPKLFKRDPHWDIFADNLSLRADDTSTNLVGLENIQLLLKLLREIPKKFAIKNVQIFFMEVVVALSSWKNGKLKGAMQEPASPVVYSSWKLELNTKVAFPWFRKDPPLTLEAETVFSMGADNKFDEVKLEKISINEFDLLQWPDVDLSESTQLSLEYIGQWVDDIKMMVQNPEMFEEPSYNGLEWNEQTLQDMLNSNPELLQNLESLQNDPEALQELLEQLDRQDLANEASENFIGEN